MGLADRKIVEALSDSHVIRGWNRHVASIIESMDDLQALLPALMDASDALTPNSQGRSGYLIFTPRDTGQDIWCYPDPIEIYDRAHKFDPFLSALLRGQTGCHVLRDVAPPDFEDSAFYQGVYSNANLKDEVIHGCRVGSTLVVVGRISRDLLTAAEIEAHRNASDVIQAAALRVAHLLLTTDQSQFFEPMRPVEYALAHFGGDVLTPRERDVIHLILRGHNTESISNQLNISPNTIKRHRSHAYKKLRVSSHGELFSHFLESLGMRWEP
jgi:DNA-binding CsgD family transcriptional regulator